MDTPHLALPQVKCPFFLSFFFFFLKHIQAQNSKTCFVRIYTYIYIFKLINLFKNFFLLCWVFVAARGLLLLWCFSCCRARTLGLAGLSSCGSRAWLLHSTWDPPGSGIEPESPALAGGLLTTAPPGKSPLFISDSSWVRGARGDRTASLSSWGPVPFPLHPSCCQ